MPSLQLKKVPENVTSVPNNQEFTLDTKPEQMKIGRNAGPWPRGMSEVGMVSREHVAIRFDQGTYFVEDLKSRNGTYLNGNKLAEMKPHPLKNGDRISVCDFEFVFRNELEEEKDDNSTIEATVTSTGGRQVLLEAQPKAKLQAILDITTELSRTLEVKDLLPKIAKKLLEPNVFPQADRCFILKLDDKKLPYPIASHVRNSRNQEDARFSRTLVRKCIERGEAMLLKSVKEDLGGDAGASIAELKIWSAMCAPLMTSKQEPIGVIQLDTTDPKRKFNEDDLKFLSCVAAQASVALENAQMHEELIKKQKEDQENRAAKSIQKALLPAVLPNLPGYQFYAFYQAARLVGGDYYDFITLPDGKQVILLGDVSGKGVPAALLMARLSGQTREAFYSTNHITSAMCRINELWYDTGIADKFVTLTAIVVDPLNHTFEYVNAGHLETWVYRHKSKDFERLGAGSDGGMAVGWLREEVYPSLNLTLEPGDCVFVYTDGIEDAESREGKRFQVEGVQRVVTNCTMRETLGNPVTAREFGESLTQAVLAHTGNYPQFDDMTMVAFSRTPEPARGTLPGVDGPPREFELDLQ